MENNLRFFPLGSGSVPVSQMHNSRNDSGYPLLNQPQLVILSHKTHADEVVSRNGLQKNIHVVVKNSPFSFTLGVTNASSCRVDLNQIAFEGHLVYDCEGEKEVDFVKVKPVEFKFVPSETGDRLECEVRIKVLTSQHEDMLFKVKIQGYHPLTRVELAGMTIVSSAIKVISKPEQLKKNKSPGATAAVVPTGVPAPVANGKKRSATEMLAETVARIEAKQEEQQRLIAKLLQQQTETSQIIEKKQRLNDDLSNSSSSASSLSMGWDQLGNDITPSSVSSISNSPQSFPPQQDKVLPSFEEAFLNLIRAYNLMSTEEKPEIIRKLIRNLPPREVERLSELLDLFWTEGLQKELGSGRSGHDVSFSSSFNTSVDGCSCNECPHKLELEKIDEFYKEFLSSGYPTQPPY